MPKELYSKEDVDQIVTELKTEIANSNIKIDSGIILTNEDSEEKSIIRSSRSEKGSITISQKFSKDFKSVPEVFFTPMTVDVGVSNDDKTIRYSYENLKITREEFSVDIVTWHESSIWHLKIKWLAIGK